ncbi:MAG: TlpA family protein disulfide reductase [Deltaproteobacteria bacterium]|nr:TlpA family protein disulfide reductase [Deltaproteobacteria bacterium]
MNQVEIRNGFLLGQKNLRALWLAVLVGLLLAGPAGAYAEQPRAPKFWISNMEGQRFDSREFEGKTIISFFYVNCAPCIEEIPELHKLVSKQYPKAALLFIDPVEDDTPQAITEFAKRLNVPLKYFYHDSIGKIGKKFYNGNMYFPTIFGISEGKVMFKITKLDEESKEKIHEVLK